MLLFLVIVRRRHRQAACPAPYPHLFAFPAVTHPRCSATLLNTTLLEMPNLLFLIPFRINTYKTGSKQTALTTFRMNTYKKQGEGGPVMVNQKSAPRTLAPGSNAETNVSVDRPNR